MASSKHSNYDYDFSSTDFLIYIWNKRVPLILISFLAGVASIIISFTITPKFKSTVVMFPTTGSSISKNLFGDNYTQNSTIYQIGEEEQSEQLMQVLSSVEIRNHIIEKYNLMEHYGIVPESKFPLTQLYAEYNSNIKIELTQYLSVVVDVLDADPQMAADIANEIAEQVDTVYHKMQKQRAMESFNLVKNEYNNMSAEIQVLEDSIKKIRELGVMHYETQAERYHEALGRAINDGNTSAQKVIQAKLDMLATYGGKYIDLRDRLQMTLGRLSRMTQRYQEAQLEATQTLPNVFIVDKAFKAEKKVSPKKSIIVIMSTLSAFFLTLFSLIVVDNIRKNIKA